MPKVRPSWRARFNLMDIIIAGSIIAIAGWLIIWAIFGDSIAYLGFIHGGGLVFGLIALAVAVISLIRKRWFFGIMGVLLGGFLTIYPSGINIAASEERLLPSDVRIMSASLRGLNREMAATAEHLAQYDADIIGLQEVFDPVAFRAALEKATDQKWFSVSYGPLAILSRYPLAARQLDIKTVLAAKVILPGRELEIWTLRAPKDYARPLVNQQFFRRLSAEIAAKNPDAVIGDFNAGPWNEGYSIVAQKMTNAQKSAGLGAGSSFPGPGRRSGLLGAYVRIDHIFVKPQTPIANAFTGTAYTASDHHPVLADLRLASKP